MRAAPQVKTLILTLTTSQGLKQPLILAPGSSKLSLAPVFPLTIRADVPEYMTMLRGTMLGKEFQRCGFGFSTWGTGVVGSTGSSGMVG